MACCDLVEDGGKVFTPLSKRCCTDILCLLLFLVYTVVMIVIAILISPRRTIRDSRRT